MMLLVGLGVNVVVVVMLFGIYSRLDQVTRELKRLEGLVRGLRNGEPGAEPSTAVSEETSSDERIAT